MGHRYNATATRDEAGWWVGTVPDVPGVVTQTRRLDLLPERLQRAVVAMLDLELDDAGSIELDFRVVLPPEVEEHLRQVRALRAAAEETSQRAREASREIAQQLVHAGYSFRDTGELLDLSHQRVSQLVKSSKGRQHS